MIYPNPYAKYNCPETGGKSKRALYNQDVKNYALAYRSDDSSSSLCIFPQKNVEFIAGLWRVQNDFPHEIINVRGREMVLGKKHDKVEFGAFHYWDGHLVSYNCYGPIIAKSPNCIIGRVDTASGSVWAYGQGIPEVRSFLSVVLFDRQRDAIFAAEGVKKQENSR